jgi:hypothetical protein
MEQHLFIMPHQIPGCMLQYQLLIDWLIIA